MKLEGANILKEDSTYTIYAFNSETAGQYCVTVPNEPKETINMLIDLHEKKLFDEVTAGTKTKEDFTKVIEEEYLNIKGVFPCGILITPMLNEDEYSNAVNNLDKQKMFDETKKIGAITSELYKKLIENGIEKQKINQKIKIVEKNETDDKYINWLKEQMPNFVEGVSLAKEETPVEQPKTETVNDIFNNQPKEEENKTEPTPQEEPVPAPIGIVEESAPVLPPVSEQVETEMPKIEGIFDNEPEPTPPQVEQPKEEKEAELPKENVDIFGIPQEQPQVTPQSEPIQEEPSTPAEPVSPELPKEEVVEPAPQEAPIELPKEEPTPTSEPTQSNEETTEKTEEPIQEPKAVQDVALEGTTAFSPIPNNPQETVENQQVEETPKKRSGGFVNLAILLAVLIVVTIISIELGKFLYSVYGA